MAGTADNTQLWEGADVFLAPTNTEGPTDLTTAWAAAWQAVGLLDGEEGFTEERDEDSAEHYAWGGILYRRQRSKHKRTFAFSCLEDNAVTFGLVNPGSTRVVEGGVVKKAIKVPTRADFAVGFELRDGQNTRRRFAKRAEVAEVDEVKESETDPTVYTVTVVVFPEPDGTLYHVLENDRA